MDSQDQKRRNRARNWEGDERRLLEELAREHRVMLTSKHSKTVTQSSKSALWFEITRQINAIGIANRSVRDVKNKWSNMHQLSKREYIEANKARSRTGGGPYCPPPSEESARIAWSYKDCPSFNGVDGGVESGIAAADPEHADTLSDDEGSFQSAGEELETMLSENTLQGAAISTCPYTPKPKLSASTQGVATAVPSSVFISKPKLPASTHSHSTATSSLGSASKPKVPLMTGPSASTSTTSSSLPKSTMPPHSKEKISQQDVWQLQCAALRGQVEGQQRAAELHDLTQRKLELQIRVLEDIIKKEKPMSATELFMSMTE